jgi:iron complex transport system substrate-binding protein
MGAFVVGMTGLAAASIFWHPFADSPPREARQSGKSASSKDVRIEVLSTDESFRTVRHALGITRVPIAPQRICALCNADELTCLGLKPHSMASGRSWALFEDYLDEKIDGVIRLPYGHLYDVLPCYEAIATCRPDLIIASPSDQHTYEQLCTIAPTLVLRNPNDSTRGNTSLDALRKRLRDLGTALGREKEAADYIADFDRHLAQIREELGPRIRGRTLACFRTRWGRWLLFGGKDVSGAGAQAIMDALGLQSPADGRGVGGDLELEDLANFDADYIVIGADDTVGAPEALDRLRSSPFIRQSTAGRTGHVYTLSKCNHWWFSGLAGKRRMLDEIAACIRGGGRP